MRILGASTGMCAGLSPLWLQQNFSSSCGLSNPQPCRPGPPQCLPEVSAYSIVTTNRYHYGGGSPVFALLSKSDFDSALQAAIAQIMKLGMHSHRPVRESAVRALDASFKRYGCLLPACIPTALCALAKLPLPEQPLQSATSSPNADGSMRLECLPALQQAMLDAAATSSQPEQLSASGARQTYPVVCHVMLAGAYRLTEPHLVWTVGQNMRRS